MRFLWILPLLSSGTVVSSAKVWAVEEGQFSFLLFKGISVASSSLTTDEETDSLCMCRRSCNMKTTCKGVSYFDNGSTKFCRQSSGGVFSITFNYHDDGIFILYNTTVTRFWFGEDGRAYLYVNVNIPRRDGQTLCNRIPEFRLGIFNSLNSMKVLKMLYEVITDEGLSIDLENDYGGGGKWGDGSSYVQANSLFPLDNSGYNTRYWLARSGTFERTSGDTTTRLVCQVDLQNGNH